MTDRDAPSPELSRRSLIRSTAAGAGALATGGAATQLGAVGSASAIDVDCEAAATGIGAVTGGVIGGVLGYAAGQAVCPPDVNRSAEQQEADWDNWVEMYNRAREGQLYDENQLAASRRDAGGMRHQGIVDAMVAAANEAATGSDKSTGMQAAKDAANAQLTKTFEGFWNHWELRAGRLDTDWQFIDSADFTTGVGTLFDFQLVGTDGEDIVTPHDIGDYIDIPVAFQTDGQDTGTFFSDPSFSTRDVTLPDGSTITVTHQEQNFSDGTTSQISGDFWMGTMFGPDLSSDSVGHYLNDYSAYVSNPRIMEPDPSTYDAVDESEVDTSDFEGSIEYLQVTEFINTLQELDQVRQNTINQVESLVNEHWDALVAGEIEPNEITSMAGVLDAVNNADSFREIIVGFKSSGHWIADTPTVVQIEDPETGELIQVDGQFSFNRTNEPDALPVGAEVNPTTLSGDLYFAYNVTNDSGEVIGANYTLMQNSFTILNTESGASSVTWTRNAIPENDVSVQDIRDVLEDIEDSRQDADQARQDINVNTGGGFSWPNLGLGGSGGLVGSLVSVVMIGIAILFGWNVVSDDS